MTQPARSTELPVAMLPQPDDVTCGPTCLHAVLRFFGDRVSLQGVIDDVPMLDSGGTLAVYLGTDALRRGYEATIYTYNLQTFDPTWFNGHADLRGRLLAQLEAKPDVKLQLSSQAYLEFLSAGGRIEFEDLTSSLLMRHLRAGEPIIAGLSATYLYQSSRERPVDDMPDDIRGEPQGHFVVISGFDQDSRTVTLSDPYRADPVTGKLRYTVGFARLICAIMLGVLTYDANLLVIRPTRGARP